jgi:serine/threonine protein kinase
VKSTIKGMMKESCRMGYLSDDFSNKSLTDFAIRSSSPLFSRRYVVIKKLGWGHFSTVWMVKDRKAVQNNQKEQYFALKVQKSAEHYTEAAMDEVELLDCIHKERNKQRSLPESQNDADGMSAGVMAEYSKYVATLHDHFFHNGPNGRHMCMVFSMLGCNLLSVIKAFNYRGIPIPVVKNMIRGCCKGLDFLHRKCHIIHTDLKPENCLLLYEGGHNSLTNSMAKLAMDDQNGVHPTLQQSIKEIEEALKNPSLSQDERKKLKRKLKKKRQKRKRVLGTVPEAEPGDDDDDDDDDDGDDDDDEEDEDGDAATAASFLSDFELTRMMSAASNLVSPRIADPGIVPDTGSVKRRLKHSPFITSNFGHRSEQADAKLMGLLQTVIGIKRPSSQELVAALSSATQEGGGGISEISFMIRAFTPEEELADGVSAALSGIPWEMSSDKSKREWYVRSWMMEGKSKVERKLSHWCFFATAF